MTMCCNFGPSKIIVVGRNFGPSLVSIVGHSLKPTQIMVVGRTFMTFKNYYCCPLYLDRPSLRFLVVNLYCWFCKASAVWASAFYKSRYPSVCPCVCSLLRYHLNVFLPPLPEVGCPKCFKIRNPWGKEVVSDFKTFTNKGCKITAHKKIFLGEFGFSKQDIFGIGVSHSF